MGKEYEQFIEDKTHCELKKHMHNLKVESYVLLGTHTEDFKPRRQHL